MSTVTLSERAAAAARMIPMLAELTTALANSRRALASYGAVPTQTTAGNLVAAIEHLEKLTANTARTMRDVLATSSTVSSPSATFRRDGGSS